MDKEHAKQVLADIKAFCEASGMKPTVFGFRAVNDGKLVSRLEGGGRVWPETAKRIDSFIREQSRASA